LLTHDAVTIPSGSFSLGQGAGAEVPPGQGAIFSFLGSPPPSFTFLAAPMFASQLFCFALQCIPSLIRLLLFLEDVCTFFFLLDEAQISFSLSLSSFRRTLSPPYVPFSLRRGRADSCIPLFFPLY